MEVFHRLDSNWAVGGVPSPMMGLGSDHVVDWKIHRWASIGLQTSFRILIGRSEWPSDADRQARLDVTAEQSIAVTPLCLGPSLSLLLSLPLCLLDLSCLFSNLEWVHDNQMRTCPPFEHLVSHLWIGHSDGLQADEPSDPFRIQRPQIFDPCILGRNTRNDRSENAAPKRHSPHSTAVPGLVTFDHRHDTVRVCPGSAHITRRHHRIWSDRTHIQDDP